MLHQYRTALDAVADMLLEKETIDGADVARIIQESMDHSATDRATLSAD